MIKKILKSVSKLLYVTSRLMLLILGLASLYLANLFLMKPVSIDHFLGKELALGLIDSPEALTYIGLFDSFDWITGHNSRLSIPEEGDNEKGVKELEKSIKTLYKYKDSRLSNIQKSTKKIAIFDFENNLRQLKEFPHHDYPLNQIGGIHLNTIEFMSDMHPVRNVPEAQGFIDRVNLIKEVYLGTLYELEEQANAGIFPPEFVYGHVIGQLEKFINYSYEEHPLFTQFMKKVRDLNLDSEQEDYFEEAIKKGIDESVTPGFILLKEFMIKTQINANKNHGIWSQPNGDEYYKLRIRSYTTTNYSPQEIHQMGLGEVERISTRMKEILTMLGYDKDKSVGELMNQLNESSEFL